MRTRWLTRATYLYLTFPFIIFCMGWLRLSIAIPVTALILWVLWQLLKQSPDNLFLIPNSRFPIYLLLLTGIWVFLSGVGGYAFQNWDQHWRNAVLRDLINFDWPVVYSSAERGPFKMLIYYVGDWLPAALAGKLLGWKFANFILFLWTWLGVFLVVLHLSKGGGTQPLHKTSPLKIILFLIFFSGMDAIGTLIFAPDYPTLFPAVQHLEIWSGNLQYSSFTTQLFWVFNQAVPAWLCVSIFVTLSRRPERSGRTAPLAPGANAGESLPHKSTEALQPQKGLPQNNTRGRLAFIWSLCFFFAPLASIGLLPYLLIEWIKQTDIKNPFKDIRLGLLFASATIVIVSYLFFSSNTAAQEYGFQSIAIKDILIFFLLEGGILWLFLAPRLWRNPYWMVTGLLLFFIPFIQLGSGRDFVMRASIAPLFYLMIMCGEVVFQNTTPRFYRIALTIMLLIGALTPLYEINRSIYRTYEYYFFLDEDQRSMIPPAPATHLEQAGALEYEHPSSLIADDIVTLQFMDDKLSRNFVANVRQSLYYRYLSTR